MWANPETGEIVPNYTMLKLNANAHPLLGRMHRPEVDPKTKQQLPFEKQDKRSLALLEPCTYERWLDRSTEDAKALVRLTPVEAFDAAPCPQPRQRTTEQALTSRRRRHLSIHWPQR